MELNTRDYARMLDLAVALIEGQEPSWLLICTEVAEVLQTRLTGAFEVKWPSGVTRSSLLDGPDWTGRLPWTRQDVADHPLVRHLAVRKDINPRCVSDVPDDRHWLTSESYAIARENFGGAYSQCLIPLGLSSEVVRYVGAARAGTDFNSHDRAYLRRIQPLLVSVDRHERVMERGRGRSSVLGIADPGKRTVGIGLTPREVTVLVLLADGLTAAAAGRQLGISPRTVLKHQENLYRKLEVHDRVSAVLAAQRLGLLDYRCPG